MKWHGTYSVQRASEARQRHCKKCIKSRVNTCMWTAVDYRKYTMIARCECSLFSVCMNDKRACRNQTQSDCKSHKHTRQTLCCSHYVQCVPPKGVIIVTIHSIHFQHYSLHVMPVCLPSSLWKSWALTPLIIEMQISCSKFVMFTSNQKPCMHVR